MKDRLIKLRVPDKVAELIRNLHPHLKRKIKFSLRQILTGPHSGKGLKDELQGMRSFRVSRFRIIYRLPQKKQIEIVAIGPRKTIYEETYILLKKRKKEG